MTFSLITRCWRMQIGHVAHVTCSSKWELQFDTQLKFIPCSCWELWVRKEPFFCQFYLFFDLTLLDNGLMDFRFLYLSDNVHKVSSRMTHTGLWYLLAMSYYSVLKKSSLNGIYISLMGDFRSNYGVETAFAFDATTLLTLMRLPCTWCHMKGNTIGY